MFFFLKKSLTVTERFLTFVVVVVHVSVTSHFVPRTVAELNRPVVRNFPLPSPHRRRFFGFAAALLAFLDFGQLSCWVRVSVVSGFFPFGWLILKMPSKKS